MLNNIKTYVINLKEEKNKFNLCLERLNKLNLKLNRFDAVYIENENNTQIKNITYPSVQYNIKHGRYSHNNIGTKNAIGCYLSHITLWKMLLDSDEEMFLIFEDDVDINNNIINFNEELNNYLTSVNTDWDLLLLGYFNINSHKIVEPIINNNYYKINNIFYGLHAYIINRKGAEQLLEKALPIVDQLDSYISYMAITRNINIYRPKYIFFIQANISHSSIQTDYSIKPYITAYDNSTIYSIIVLLIFLIILFLYLCIHCTQIHNYINKISY